MKDEIITVNKTQIVQFATDGSKLAFKKDAEAQLIKLLDLKDFLEGVIENVKKDIAASGRKAVGNDFKGIFGEKIKAVFRAYGNRWTTTNPDFIREVVVKKPDTKKIEGYIEERGELPPMTSENEREGQLVITRINDEIKQIAT